MTGETGNAVTARREVIAANSVDRDEMVADYAMILQNAR